MNIERSDSTRNTVDLLNLDQQVANELGADDGAAVAALLVAGARDSRDREAVEGQAEEQQAAELADRQVARMYDEADATRAAGLVRGIGSMVSGALSAVGSVEAAHCSSAAASERTSAGFAGAAKISEGVSGLVGAEEDFRARIAEADAARAGNLEKSAERRASQLEQSVQQSDELCRSALQAASELVRTEGAAQQATLFLRG